jgi:predicted 3-demethylubiquinone-9 3-methyltransferase (glyoxalase superfamily)
MLRNRSFQVKMVKDQPEMAPVPFQLADVDFQAIDKIVRKYAFAAAVGIVLMYAAVKTVDTASEVIVNNTNPIR